MTDETTTENQKNCLECGLPLGAGRSDRKFCNDICRTAFNNRRRAGDITKPAAAHEARPGQRSPDRDSAAIKKVQDILVSNRSKLMHMHSLYETSMGLNEFYGFGVNLKYFTSEYNDDYYDKVFRMCFDYGYHIDGDRVYLIYSGAEIHFN
ncbi:hypothetical protein ACFGVS_00750 [Mucilaginibacter sp. AW1-7]|uniref:hypothetical protein n=1 Tax=Mucilaginibacter sp. AW1-7 TaxID=3349874 RepID=UPI003F73F30C